jgi:hypothetical protein
MPAASVRGRGGPRCSTRRESCSRRRSSVGIAPVFERTERWKSSPRGGRPKTPEDIRQLIHEMSVANPLWGAPRIHGELLKLGIDVGQTTAAKYMARRRRPPSQGWKTFLHNHADGIASIDMSQPTSRTGSGHASGGDRVMTIRQTIPSPQTLPRAGLHVGVGSRVIAKLLISLVPGERFELPTNGLQNSESGFRKFKQKDSKNN